MIRIKNNVLPVWFQWDGDEASMKRALETIVTDIQMNGFNHYTTYVDVCIVNTAQYFLVNGIIYYLK